MVARILDEKRITGGESLLEALDEAGLKVNAAFWFLFPDFEQWRLVISLPKLEAKGPRHAYEEVQKVLRKANDATSIALSDVTIAPKKSRLLELLRSAVKTGPGISRIRFSDNVVNGQYITDALIYRLN